LHGRAGGAQLISVKSVSALIESESKKAAALRFVLFRVQH
jgi:hypothetical protein